MFVLDATALVAVIDGSQPAYRIWERADNEELTIAIPALAILDAGEQRQVDRGAWDAILWSPTVEVLPLGQTGAVEIGVWRGVLHARHALWEAERLGWPVLTADPGLYGPQARVLAV